MTSETAPDICGGLLPGGRGGFSVTTYPTLNNGMFYGRRRGSIGHGLTTPSTSTGGNGGGIVIIHADTIIGNGRLITARGGDGSNNTAASSGAAGGGGRRLRGSQYKTFCNQSRYLMPDGGKGGDNINQNGAGGGGGGGLIWTAGAFPGTATVAGGQGGIHSAGDPNKDGLAGTIRNNLNLPLNGFLFNEIYVSHNLTMLDSICEGMIPPKLTGTKPAGGSGTYTYQWQKSYDNLHLGKCPGHNHRLYAGIN
ncbi:MAG: hypothetical protein MZV63_18475 [Marinilabiliales bacterium]|nr:hypothetical protein [Marinilabiliales bacterium]